MIQQSRRGFLSGLGAIIAAPAIVRASSLMPIKPMAPSGMLWTQVPPEQILADMDFMLKQLLLVTERNYLDSRFPIIGDHRPTLLASA